MAVPRVPVGREGLQPRTQQENAALRQPPLPVRPRVPAHGEPRAQSKVLPQAVPGVHGTVQEWGALLDDA